MNRTARILNWLGIVLCLLLVAVSAIQLLAGGFQFAFALCIVVGLYTALVSYAKLKVDRG